jgi:hypothetical protein
MKKILFLATVITFTMASCAKDRTCTCTTTAPGYSATEKVTIVESTKGQAKANCVSTSQTESGVTVTRDCKLD